MFGPLGIAYVYLVYGMYECLNVVTEADGRPAAVLIRAVEPIDGVDSIRASRLERALTRGRSSPREGEAAAVAMRVAALPATRLCSGPGLVTAGFGISRTDTGTDLLDAASTLRLEARPAGEREPAIEATPRVGIGYAAEPWRSRLWRFIDAESPSPSGRAATSGPVRNTAATPLLPPAD